MACREPVEKNGRYATEWIVNRFSNGRSSDLQKGHAGSPAAACVWAIRRAIFWSRLLSVSACAVAYRLSKQAVSSQYSVSAFKWSMMSQFSGSLAFTAHSIARLRALYPMFAFWRLFLLYLLFFIFIFVCLFLMHILLGGRWKCDKWKYETWKCGTKNKG